MQDAVNKCCLILEKGGTILYPTDTIWGIGCDATNPSAVDKVYKIKHRAEQKSMIILLADISQLDDYVRTIPGVAFDLMAQAEKPLTIIYPDSKNLATNVIATDNSVAIRIVRHPFCAALIRTLGRPIVSTSANISGEAPPASFNKIRQEIIESVDYVADANLDTTLSSSPSSILRLSLTGEVTVIRQ